MPEAWADWGLAGDRFPHLRSTITDFEEIVQMDVDYIDHWSIWRDIGILFKTVWLVVCGDDGAQ